MQRPAKPCTPVRFRLQPPRVMKKILITGVSGFIGAHLALKLLSLGNKIIGIDNLNEYYDVNLKKHRLNKLKKYDSFYFFNSGIESFEEVNGIFLDNKPDIVINLAAQAGVRYSLVNPKSYIDSNILGFHNILECSKLINPERVIYASSSSVYGDSTKVPFAENDLTDQTISLYAATKKSNEQFAYAFSHNFNIPTIGLRFFTVYGPMGRPDMAYYLFTEKLINNEPIVIYNKGEMSRDMTYIDDIVTGIEGSISIDLSSNESRIYNLGNSNPVPLNKLINFLEGYCSKSFLREYKEINTEVKTTFANIQKSKRELGFLPKTNFETGMTNFLDWYFKFKGTK